MSNKRPIYHGWNDTQEFWENDHFVIIRCREEKAWSIHAKSGGGYAFLDWADTPEAAAERVSCVLDKSKSWEKKGAVYALV